MATPGYSDKKRIQMHTELASKRAVCHWHMSCKTRREASGFLFRRKRCRLARARGAVGVAEPR